MQFGAYETHGFYDEMFDPGGRSVPSTIRLWPGLLLAAILLNLAEVVQRKWPGVFQGARSR